MAMREVRLGLRVRFWFTSDLQRDGYCRCGAIFAGFAQDSTGLVQQTDWKRSIRVTELRDLLVTETESQVAAPLEILQVLVGQALRPTNPRLPFAGSHRRLDVVDIALKHHGGGSLLPPLSRPLGLFFHADFFIAALRNELQWAYKGFEMGCGRDDADGMDRQHWMG
ncbi:hypothetical protein M5K25_011203 [Dendrobium thyrsiflorum]|uniref:Uncharacterized protein n=1 Tax=Dendrobium thyrsiflorum TaxID=117978 RepID=A0ABD0V220_DENTH